MLIRKLFKFENAHIVRGCSTVRCRSSVHGHSYEVEVLIESNFLDQGQMVYDFGLTKLSIKELIDSFDHAISLWEEDDPSYLEAMRTHSDRWLQLPVSPSAEQMARVIFVMLDMLLQQTKKINGEKEVALHSIIVHETKTGYAQAFRKDAYNQNMGVIDPAKIIFSPSIISDWNDPFLWEKVKDGTIFTNPTSV